MKINPEFRRNLWLELSPLRLIGMPLALAAFFLVPYAAEGKQLGPLVAQAALVLLGLLTVVWGVKLAGESVVSEIRDRTWDGQRMSVIGPWAMSWGKLVGATLFPWYGAIFCVLVYLVSVPSGGGPAPWKTVLVVAGSAFVGQTLALLASLVSIRKNRRFSRSQTASYSVLGIMAAIFAMQYGFRGQETVYWFGISFRYVDFTLISMILFLCWIGAGIYRLMRLELKLKNHPWDWLGFVLFSMVFSAGFSLDAGQGFSAEAVSSSLFMAYGVGVSLVYLAAFAEPKDPMRFRRLFLAWEKRAWRAFFQGCPSWVMALPLLLVVVFLLFVVPSEKPVHAIRHFRFSLIAFQFFFFRDLALLVYLNLSKKPKRAEMLAVLWLVLLWGVFPSVFSVLGFGSLAAFFHPWLGAGAVISLIASPFEMLLVAWFAMRRWKVFSVLPLSLLIRKTPCRHM